MLMDDIQDREDAKNAELADATYSWMLATLMRARSPFGCTFIYTGNMYPQNSILEKLKNNSHWTSLIAGGILEDGQSLFEDLRPLAELLEEYDADLEAGHPEIFISEVQNCTDLPLASGIDLSKIKQLPTYLVSLPPSAGEAAFIIIDPSAGKKKSDDCTLTYYQVVDGKPIAREIVFGVFSPMQTIDAALSLGFQHDCRAIFVEGVAYQSTLLFWFEFICNQRGISGFFFGELQPKGQNKNNRIKQGYTKLVAGELYLHPAVRSLVLDQYATWIPTRTNNKDDIIDPIGYVEEVMRDYELEIIRPIFHAISHEAGVTASHSDASCPF
jgi:hypothetical protein